MPRPDTTLCQYALSDQGLFRRVRSAEWDAAGKLDRTNTWRDYTDEQLIACRRAVAHLEDDGYVYYLPAFLSFLVRNANAHPETPAGELAGSVLFALVEVSAPNRVLHALLSPAQKRAVVRVMQAFLGTCRDPEDLEDTRDALDAYWCNGEVDRPIVII